MSARTSVYVINDAATDGGVSPNAYVPKVTAEVRLHFPPTDRGIIDAHDVLERTIVDARAALDAKVEELEEAYAARVARRKAQARV